MKKVLTILVWFFCLSLILSIPTSKANANSAPPPFRLWFTFSTEKDASPIITALQLLGCENELCNAKQYLIGYGNCSSQTCLQSERVLSADWYLNCIENRCYLEKQYNFTDELPPYIQLIFTVKGKTIVSDTFAFTPQTYGDQKLLITASADQANIVEEQESNIKKESFTFTFGLTTLIELAVVLLIIIIGKKFISIPIRRVLFLTLTANVLSYPIVWFTLPSLEYFSSDSSQKFGLITALAVILITALIYFLWKKSSAIKKWLKVVMILVFPVIIIVTLLSGFLVSYGNYDIAALGLSSTLTTIICELFAVCFEAAILFLFSKNQIGLKQAAGISLLMNAASFLTGLLLK